MSLEGYTIYEPRFVTSADGTQISADAAGNRAADRPVIVLIHGFSVIKESFDSIFEDPNWVHDAFLVRYDTRGHGKSGKPLADEAWESRRMSEDFEAVCKEFGVQKAFVLGWSLGATHFPDIVTYNTTVEIAGLINITGLPYIDIVARIADPEGTVISRILAQPPSVDAFQEATFSFIRACSDFISEDLFRKLLEGILLQPRAVTMKVYTRKQDVGKFLQEAREGKLDALVVIGGKDKLITGKELEAAYKDLGWKRYTLEHLDEADHLPWISSPEKFRNVVLGWVKERHR